MKLPLKAITNFARSPKGQRMLRDAKTKLDTPENRRKVQDVLQRRRGGSAPGSR